jgi:hypothetical protein
MVSQRNLAAVRAALGGLPSLTPAAPVEFTRPWEQRRVTHAPPTAPAPAPVEFTRPWEQRRVTHAPPTAPAPAVVRRCKSRESQFYCCAYSDSNPLNQIGEVVAYSTICYKDPLSRQIRYNYMKED